MKWIFNMNKWEIILLYIRRVCICMEWQSRGRREGPGRTAAERRLQEVWKFWLLPFYFCLPAARSGSSKHGTPGRCHFTLRRCKKQFLLRFEFYMHSLCGFWEVECSISLSLFFNAEFKKNGNNNNSSSVPVSMRSPVPAALATVALCRLLLVAFVLLLIFLKAGTRSKVSGGWWEWVGRGLVKDCSLWNRCLRLQKKLVYRVRSEWQSPLWTSLIFWELLRGRDCKPHKARAHPGPHTCIALGTWWTLKWYLPTVCAWGFSQSGCTFPGEWSTSVTFVLHSHVRAKSLQLCHLNVSDSLQCYGL